MSKRREIATDLEQYIIVRSINDHDQLFAILKADHKAMDDLIQTYRETNQPIPDDAQVLALAMGKVGEVNQFTDRFDIISENQLSLPINSIEGVFIKISNW